MKRRYCQKFSPGPGRRRPWSPWMTVAATRRASRISRGMVAASERPSPSARRISRASSGNAAFVAAMRLSDLWAKFLADLGLQPADHRGNRLAVGARREGQRHAVLEDRLGQCGDVVDRGRVTALEQCAGANREHERLAGARTRPPGDEL